MRIAIDIRSLTEPLPSGISEYTRQIISHILALDRDNEYLLFCNVWKRTLCIDDFLRYPNVKLKLFHYPNKVFNTALSVFNYPKLDRWLDKIDIFFLPNFPTFAAFSCRCRLVVTVHDLSFLYPDFYKLKVKLWHRAVKPRRTLKRADYVIAVSENTKRDVLQNYGLSASKVRVIYSGISAERFQNIEENKLLQIQQHYQLAQPFVLYFGTVEERKNIAGLLSAWQTFQQHFPLDVELVIAGRIAEPRLVQSMPRLRFLGYLPQEDKPYIYHLAKAMIYPSYYEGFGFPVLEAMAAGVPVVTSFSTSLPEVAGRAALLVNPYNTFELAMAIGEVLTNRELRTHLIRQGKATVQQFTWRKAAQTTLSLFNSIKI